MDNYFKLLNDINVNVNTDDKNGLKYLPWAWAWAEVKKRFPESTYTIYENKDGLFYHTDGSTCWVKTGVTVNGIEHIEYLPVMDFKNKSIPFPAPSTDVNKAIQRSLTKAVARHGLGLYIYAGEDLPEEEQNAKVEELRQAQAPVDRDTLKEQLVSLYEGDTDKLSGDISTVYGCGIDSLTDEQLAECKRRIIIKRRSKK